MKATICRLTSVTHWILMKLNREMRAHFIYLIKISSMAKNFNLQIMINKNAQTKISKKELHQLQSFQINKEIRVKRRS